MTTVLVPLAQGCEELEAVTVIDLLRRADVQVITASLDEQKTILASRGVQLIADKRLADLADENFDMIILPGGQPGTNHLIADETLKKILLRHHAAGHFLAAICAAPWVFAEHGLLAGKTCTLYPDVLTASDWPTIDFSAEAVVQSGNIITSRGPGTAMDFALALIEILRGKERRQQVEADLVRH